MNLANYIDHTILKPDTMKSQVEKICEEARAHGFFSVCVNPIHVKLCKEKLVGSAVKVCSVIGFPLGANLTSTKVFETEQAIIDGADEIDMVINIGALKDKNDDFVRSDIEKVAKACEDKALLKVIIETCLLTEEEKIRACQLAKEAGADFVKTSTGFSSGGATAEDVSLMKKTVGKEMGVKASGGVRDQSTAEKMIESGATRIGASASVAIAKGQAGQGDY